MIPEPPSIDELKNRVRRLTVLGSALGIVVAVLAISYMSKLVEIEALSTELELIGWPQLVESDPDNSTGVGWEVVPVDDHEWVDISATKDWDGKIEVRNDRSSILSYTVATSIDSGQQEWIGLALIDKGVAIATFDDGKWVFDDTPEVRAKMMDIVRLVLSTQGVPEPVMDLYCEDLTDGLLAKLIEARDERDAYEAGLASVLKTLAASQPQPTTATEALVGGTSHQADGHEFLYVAPTSVKEWRIPAVSLQSNGKEIAYLEGHKPEVDRR